MSSTVLFPATEALHAQERRRPRADKPALMSSKVDFGMNSIFEQAIALESAAFAPFPNISWSFDSDSSDNEAEFSSAKKVKKGKKTMKQFDDILKTHRRQNRPKHSSPRRSMVRSKAQYNGLSCLAGSTSSMHSLPSFLRLTATSS